MTCQFQCKQPHQKALLYLRPAPINDLRALVNKRVTRIAFSWNVPGYHGAAIVLFWYHGTAGSPSKGRGESYYYFAKNWITPTKIE